jgi:hypothetical protein
MHSPTTAVSPSGVKRNQSSVVFFQTTRGGYSASAERLPPVGAPVGVVGAACVPLTCSHTAAHASTTLVQVIHKLHDVRAILSEEKKGRRRCAPACAIGTCSECRPQVLRTENCDNSVRVRQ